MRHCCCFSGAGSGSGSGGGSGGSPSSILPEQPPTPHHTTRSADGPFVMNHELEIQQAFADCKCFFRQWVL